MELNLLIVDKRPITRLRLRRVLEVSGLPVEGCFEAATVDEAVKQLHNHWCDAVLIDQQLGEDQGGVLLQKLRDDEVLHMVYRVALSADPRAGVRQAAEEQGAQDWLHKPVTPERLRKSLISLLNE